MQVFVIVDADGYQYDDWSSYSEDMARQRVNDILEETGEKVFFTSYREE